MRSIPLLSAPAALFYCTWAEELHEASGAPSGPPAVAVFLAGYLFLSSVAIWVVADAQRSGQPLPYDYASFVFAFWPLFALIYLFSAHGRRAFIPIGWSFLIVLAGASAAWLPTGIAYLFLH